MNSVSMNGVSDNRVSMVRSRLGSGSVRFQVQIRFRFRLGSVNGASVANNGVSVNYEYYY